MPSPLLIDMVHHNPGEAPFATRYNDPRSLVPLGYSAKVFELFESAQFGVDWASTDPEVARPGSLEQAWVTTKAQELHRLYNATKDAGLQVFCHTDMIVLPQSLIAARGLTRPGDISDPSTKAAVRDLLAGIFDQFPEVDGLVVRIGETYLHSAPHHHGTIDGRTDAHRTIMPLMSLLREEVCVRRGKQVLFRAWYSFDTDLATYQAVSDGVEPHPNLLIVVKHCEGDFHRGNPFSKVLGQGRHRQLIEVQAQREYEGKGAYPNYIAHGLIDGFEEHAGQPGANLRTLWAHPLIAGVSTWSRGGGWKGPYLRNEFWCDLNLTILSRWIREPRRTEEDLFHEFAQGDLGLDALGSTRFRALCLGSAAAILRGRRSTVPDDVSPWWTRDQYIGVPPLPAAPTARARVLSDKDEAVARWEWIVNLADSLVFADTAITRYVQTSSRYGLYLYRIYRAAFYLAAHGGRGDPATRSLIRDYDAAWADLRHLHATAPDCATLYEANGFTLDDTTQPGIGAFVDALRESRSGVRPRRDPCGRPPG